MKKNLFNIDTEAFIIQQMIEESDGEMTPEIEEKLMINEEERTTKGVGYVFVVKEFQAKADMIAEEIKRLNAIKKQYENAVDRLKNSLLDSVKMNGPIITDQVKISSRTYKSVSITDELELPDEFLRVKYEPKKAEIKTAIDMGIEVPGACIVETISLNIK